MIFQSTLPREERRKSAWNLMSSSNFNPRSHERSDINAFMDSVKRIDFNPRSHERSDYNLRQTGKWLI